MILLKVVITNNFKFSEWNRYTYLFVGGLCILLVILVEPRTITFFKRLFKKDSPQSNSTSKAESRSESKVEYRTYNYFIFTEGTSITKKIKNFPEDIKNNQ